MRHTPRVDTFHVWTRSTCGHVPRVSVARPICPDLQAMQGCGGGSVRQKLGKNRVVSRVCFRPCVFGTRLWFMSLINSLTSGKNKFVEKGVNR